MDTSVSFVIDAPVTLAEGESTISRVQIGKTGKFKDPRYGEFTITRADFAKWMSNFQVLAVDGDRAGLPVDVDHGPEKTGNTEASGWILALDTKGKDGKTDTPDELWATTEWNDLGVELIKNKRYRYLSPSYAHDKKDETGKSYGTALVGVGMTNRPFLQMATVSLSEAPLVAERLADEPSESQPVDSRRRMALTDEALKKLGLADGATDEEISLAVAALSAPTEQKTLDQLAGESGKVVLDATEYTSMRADATAGAEAAKTLKANTFESAWQGALNHRDGAKVTPAQKDNFLAIYEGQPEIALKMLDELQPVVHTTTKGATGDPHATLSGAHQRDAEGDAVDEDASAIDTRAQAILAEKSWGGDRYQDAVILAASELGA